MRASHKRVQKRQLLALCNYKQDAFFEKLSRRFACKTDTSVGHYRWFNKICLVASYIALRFDQILAHAAILMKDFTVCQQANRSQFNRHIQWTNFNERRTGHTFDLD